MADTTISAIAVVQPAIHTINTEQVRKACSALQSRLKQQNGDAEASQTNKKVDLLMDGDDETTGENGKEAPIWVVVTAKQHLVTKTRLKPAKIAVPHPIHKSADMRICLITADPPASRPRIYKEIVASEEFPALLRSRVVKVIPYSRLRAKHKSFESLRKLNAEYDLFLADDRVINLLPHTLGKIFYKTASKRPIPVVLSGKKETQSKEIPEQDRAVAKLARKRKFSETGGPESIATATSIAAEIEKALSSVLVNLSQSANCEIKAAISTWSVDEITSNVQAVVESMVERFVPKKWNGVRGIYIKGQHTAALPIWLADELWTGEDDILRGADTMEVDSPEAGRKPKKKLLQDAQGTTTGAHSHRKRKLENGDDANGASKKSSDLKAMAKQRKSTLMDLKADALNDVAVS